MRKQKFANVDALMFWHFELLTLQLTAKTAKIAWQLKQAS